MVEGGDVGLRGIGVSGSGYNEDLELEVLNVVHHIEQRRSVELFSVKSGSSRSRCHAVGRACVRAGVRACVHIYMLNVCVYICVCMYVYGHVHMYVYACVYVSVYICMYIHLYMYVYAYLCIDCESQ